MTIKELRQALHGLPPNAEVVIETPDGEAYGMGDVSIEGGPNGRVLLTGWAAA